MDAHIARRAAFRESAARFESRRRESWDRNLQREASRYRSNFAKRFRPLTSSASMLAPLAAQGMDLGFLSYPMQAMAYVPRLAQAGAPLVLATALITVAACRAGPCAVRRAAAPRAPTGSTC